MDKKKFKINLFLSMILSMIISGVAVLLLLSGSLVAVYIVSSSAYYNFINLYHSNRLFMECYMIGSVVLFLVFMFLIMNYRINKLMEKFN